MPVFQGFDTMLVLWGAVVLAFAFVRHIYFGGAEGGNQ